MGDESNKTLTASKKYWEGIKKKYQKKILHVQHRLEPERGGENLCAMGDQKILLEIHAPGRRSRNTTFHFSRCAPARATERGTL